ncbi:MAG: Stf0 family sulfotransferase [Pseudohongiellaceae bacterium]|nr:Stf0 family sulfotransferase [Pseudohongiellaceae bacterium]
MAIRISDKNRREMDPSRDFAKSVPVTQRYCILSSPRSGSTLLSRMLYETKLAGDPQEYFNPPIIQLATEQAGKKTLQLNEYLKLMESRRTSGNGVFGIKTHYSQLLSLFKVKQPNKQLVAFLSGFDQLIWIRRRDRLMQGISQAIAQQTQVWSSEDSRHGSTDDVEIHPYACLHAARLIAGDDFGWERLIQAAKLNVLTVWYEDLVGDYEAQSRRVLEHLKISDQVDQIPEPPLQKQGGELNEKIHANLLRYLGLSEEVK